MKIKYIIQMIVILVATLFFLFIGVEYEIWRWHMFQSLTHNQIGFWTYLFLFHR